MPKRQLRRSFDDKGFTGRRIYGDRKRKRLEEAVEMVALTKEFSTLRMVGPVMAYALWWMDIKTQAGKKVSIPKVPLAFDPASGELDPDVSDPYSKLEDAKLQVSYLVNAIDRSVQDNEPKRKSEPTAEEDASGFKDKSSGTWTPVRVVRLPPMVAQQMQALATQNRYKVKTKTGAVQARTFDLNHFKYGRDVYLSKDKDSKSPSGMYNLSLADKSPLTDEEADYLIWDLESLDKEGGPFHPESPEEAAREAESLASKLSGIDGGELAGPAGQQAVKDDLAEDFLAEDDDGDDELPWDIPDDGAGADEDEDEDEPPAHAERKARKPKGKGKGKGKGGGGSVSRAKRLGKAARAKQGKGSAGGSGKGKTPLKSRKKLRRLRSE